MEFPMPDPISDTPGNVMRALPGSLPGGAYDRDSMKRTGPGIRRSGNATNCKPVALVGMSRRP